MVTGTDNSHLSNLPLTNLLAHFLDQGFSVSLRAHGVSMEPFIKNGDIVTLTPVSERTIKLGDVVAVRQAESGAMLLHRVIQKLHAGFLIQGDNKAQPDGTFDSQFILGVVTRVERNGKNVQVGANKLNALVAYLVRYRLVVRWNILKGLSWWGRVQKFWQLLTTKLQSGRASPH